MGISSMPTPKDSLMGFVLYNTAVSVAILAGLVRAALVFLGLAAPSPWEGLAADEHPHHHRRRQVVSSISPLGPSLADRFRSRFRPSRFGRRRGGAGADCRVCLARFEPESVVNRLPCGHLFHRGCLETWLRYERATCPLCRAHVPVPAVPADDTPGLRYPECE